jgi:hypothetical protein
MRCRLGRYARASHGRIPASAQAGADPIAIRADHIADIDHPRHRAVQMRRYPKILAAVLATALALSAARFWVGDRVEAATHRPHLCLKPVDRAMMTDERFTPDQQDIWIAKAANFEASVPSAHLWRHVRGVLLQAGLGVFWTAGQRAAIFRTMVARMPACS